MNVAGFRCSNTDYAVAVLTGTRETPELVTTDIVRYPKGFAKPRSLKWLLQEVESLLVKHKVEKIVVNKYQGRTMGNAFEDRVEHEAMVFLAAANTSIVLVSKRGKSTIAKSLGLKGRARYLSTSLDTTVIPNWDAYPPKVQDAILAGWSSLP